MKTLLLQRAIHIPDLEVNRISEERVDEKETNVGEEEIVGLIANHGMKEKIKHVI